METPASKNNYQEFNQFQTYFYTNPQQFDLYSNFEIKRNAVALLTNICKGYPLLAKEILNIYSPEVKAIESPAIIKALQRDKFVNGFSKPRLPQFIFYKQGKVTKPKTVKNKTKTTKSKGKQIIEFEDEVIDKIQTILMLDNKDYHDLKGSEMVQNLGINLTRNLNLSNTIE